MNYDYIIIGAGPSSLTLAYYFSKLKIKCLIFVNLKTVRLATIDYNLGAID